MKKLISVLLLAIVVLSMFVSCHQCIVCGEKKLITEKKTVLGREVYVCKECKDAPENALNNVKNGLQQAGNDVKDGLQKAGNDIKGIFNK